MKIIDAFTFNNEIDIVKDRLEYLYDYVDQFLIVESNYTHTGTEKPLHFANNRLQFDKYKDKIDLRRLYVDKEYDFTDSWKLENAQRNFIGMCIDEYSDNDIVIVSDADEIPDRSKFDELKHMMSSHNIVRFNETMFYYNLSTRLTSFPFWGASYAAKKKYVVSSGANNLRMGMRTDSDGSITAGWHLTYFMTPEQIKSKLESFAHNMYNTDYYKDVDRLQACIDEQRDLFDREDHKFENVDPDAFFPKEFLQVFSKWK